MRVLHKLKPSHYVALRLIALGMSVREAAELIGISPTYLSTIKSSELGQAYILKLHALANEYTARLMALGLTPAHILQSSGKTKRPNGANWTSEDC